MWRVDMNECVFARIRDLRASKYAVVNECMASGPCPDETRPHPLHCNVYIKFMITKIGEYNKGTI